ncbi:MAG: bifunctional aspartate kinase/homoserine dehydrogenase I [Sphingobacteriales bacterium]|nr:bifunctional aspartate kinase/homoserine dehydrogenase I [Sphingobacteriales bacterium]
MIVLKFGGTSVGSVAAIETLKNIVADTLRHHNNAVVVVSAMSGITDLLINSGKAAENGDKAFETNLLQLRLRHEEVINMLLHKQAAAAHDFLNEQLQLLHDLLNGVLLLKEMSARTLDCIASFGEVISSKIVTLYMQEHFSSVAHVDARQLIRTDKNFTAARVDFAVTDMLLRQAISPQTHLYVMGGFVAATAEGVTTTLGRGGSDYTAAIVAAALDADLLEIWTDVNGVLTADPRKVKKALTLPQMTYEEAAEMSHFGAKVIYPPTIQPAMRKNIPIRIANTFNATHAGTLITRRSHDTAPVKCISSISNVALVNIQGTGMIGVSGVAARIFKTMALQEVNIILITQASSEHSITFAINPQDAAKAQQALQEEFDYELKNNLLNEINIEQDMCVVALIGFNMRRSIGVSGKMFGALGKNGVNIRAIAQGSSEMNISVVVDKAEERKALNTLHDAFFLSDITALNLFLVGGTGLIGSTLIRQIQQHAAFLKEKQQFEIKLVGVANSRTQYINEEGVDLNEYQGVLEQKGEKHDLAAFIHEMIALNLPNSIFIDSTASPEVIAFYDDILKESISLITPNKLANSGKWQDYENLHAIARKFGVQFLYETNVGAGLPVISTLKGLLNSGDEVLKIEAVLSGSMSFVFNNFKDEIKFSDIVKEAQVRGYTEPDPREDLSGADVARKVLILAREMGLPLEIGDIVIENILPQSCIAAPHVEAFFRALENNENHFEQLKQQAQQNNKVLRFIAEIDPQGARIALRGVAADSPFYALSGSDNMIVFTTARYKERPLVVKGPGAGAEVTAAGVLAEIVSVGNYLS